MALFIQHKLRSAIGKLRGSTNGKDVVLQTQLKSYELKISQQLRLVTPFARARLAALSSNMELQEQQPTNLAARM